jgi:hypothetical protein
MQAHKCSRCDKTFETYDQLRRHTGRIHKVNSTDFYVEIHLNGVWPTCKCGCGNEVLWSHQLKGFREFVAGHQSRVHNNWGHNPKAIEASSKTRREQFERGERKVWNDGLTIGDVRVKENVESLTRAIQTTDERCARSDRMTMFRLSGIVPTLSGSLHPRWKGGVSTINQLARSDRRLYNDWKYPILERDGFKCTRCPNTTHLHVHHDDETFSEIMGKVITEDDLLHIDDQERKRDIVNRITEYHITNNVSGITLCHDCHAEIHPTLNFT